MDQLGFAEALIKQDFHLLALKEDKRPAPAYPKGFKSATKNWEEFKSKWNDGNLIGLPTGINKLIVVDFDLHKMKDDQKEYWSKKKEEWLKDGHVIQTTRSGGFHVFMIQPEGTSYTQGGNVPIGKWTPSCIDVRCTRGYVAIYEEVNIARAKACPQVFTDMLEGKENKPSTVPNDHSLFGQLGKWLIDNGWDKGKYQKNGSWRNLKHCPWHDQHTTGDHEGDCQWKPIGDKAVFKCHHASCEGKTNEEFYEFFASEGAPTVHATREPKYSSKEYESSIVSLSDIIIENPTWIWEHHIPRGRITIYAGDSGIGKTTMLCDLIGRMTRGDLAPDGAKMSPGRVLFVTNEDDLKVTLTPRLIAAGADLSYIKAIYDSDDFDISNPDHYKTFIKVNKAEQEYDLIIIDAISALGAQVHNSNNAEQVRALLNPLSSMVADTQVAVLGVMHSRKGTKDTKEHPLLERVSGSKSWTNKARSVLFALKSKSEDNTFAFGSCKNSLGPIVGSGLYSIEGAVAKQGLVEVSTSRLKWKDWDSTLRMDPDRIQAMEQAPEKTTKAARFARILGSKVSELGFLSKDDAGALAEEEGLCSAKTFYRKYYLVDEFCVSAGVIRKGPASGRKSGLVPRESELDLDDQGE